MFHLKLVLHSYVGHPYWSEMERLINITKESGMNRARSTANRRKSLEEYLQHNNMTLAEYEELEKSANRPFKVDNNGFIIVPQTSVEAMMVDCCINARAAYKPCSPDKVRSAMKFSSWTTDIKPESALTWERFVVVTAGTGAKLSNQRAMRRNQYIGADPPGEIESTKPVHATGTLRLNADMVKPDTVKKALEWAGTAVRIGASRKMGWGVFSLEDWTED